MFARIGIAFLLINQCWSSLEEPRHLDELSSERVSSNSLFTFDYIYESGLNYYTKGKWNEAIQLLLTSIQDYFWFKKQVLHCRKECRTFGQPENPDGGVRFNRHLYSSLFLNIDGQRSLELTGVFHLFKRAECMQRCKRLLFGSRPEKVTADIRNAFETLLPLNYLQHAFYKSGDLRSAAIYAYTLALRHRNDSSIQKAISFYIESGGVDSRELRDLLVPKHEVFYFDAVKAYKNELYEVAIPLFEASVKELFIQFEECLDWCESEVNSGEFQPELILTLAQNWFNVVECQRTCQTKSMQLGGKQDDSLLANIYHHLQFAAWKANKVKEACRYTSDYLLLRPDDDVMKKNKEFYLGVEGVDGNTMKPSENLVEYLNIIRMLKSISDMKLDLATPDEEERDPSNDALVVLENKALNGSARFVADGLANRVSCGQLIQLVKDVGRPGDGYNGTPRPFTETEVFRGISIGRALKAALMGQTSLALVDAFISLADRSRQFIQDYFRLPELYFSFAHTVCREALKNDNPESVKLSHPVHSDNCILKSDGTCLREPPAFVHRDYSAILYLNEDFDGGEFFFAYPNETEQATVKPMCGRLVAFKNGVENLHGVRAVHGGQRCAMALWFTLNQSERDKEEELVHRALIERKEIAMDDLIKATAYYEVPNVNSPADKSREAKNEL